MGKTHLHFVALQLGHSVDGYNAIYDLYAFMAENHKSILDVICHHINDCGIDVLHRSSVVIITDNRKNERFSVFINAALAKMIEEHNIFTEEARKQKFGEL